METAIPRRTLQYFEPPQLRPTRGSTGRPRRPESSVRTVSGDPGAGPGWKSVLGKCRQRFVKFALPNGSAPFDPIRAEVNVLSSSTGAQTAGAPESPTIL